MQNADTTKYIIHSKISAEGIIERPDIVGAIFGQTEGLLGSDLDLRDLQKTGRIGRIEVLVSAKGGKSKGTILVPSSLDKVETSILAASLETIDRVGPCSAKIEITNIEDVRATKRKQIIERAKFILTGMFDTNVPESQEIADEVRQSVRVEEMQYFGKNKIPCGPAVFDSDAIVVVEGRADVLNLLRYGIKNTICVGGTNVPPEVAELTKKKETVTAFTDGDRGGELIIKELLQVANIDYIARAPDGKSVEDLVQKEIVRALRQKIPVEQVMDRYSLKDSDSMTTPTVQRVPKQKERRPVEIPRVTTPAKLKKRPIKQREFSQETVAVQAPHKEEPEVVEVIKLSPAAKKFKSHADELMGTFGARFLDAGNNVIGETAVRDLVNNLKDYNGDIKSVIFDGVITQRILDIAENKGIENLVGAKIGSITKRPSSVKILTVRDL
ncbi:DNA primase DnaG [uncultured Methanomethylovorans sp.]|uniref:DNA primase DnaG n=1 Tax=uncultured Methanomethylovorans sp. TaxID=183759 RepID=UPI002AA7714C|nr:DNA primase DnaG [uncultured Methanomethylovorans sp.]